MALRQRRLGQAAAGGRGRRTCRRRRGSGWATAPAADRGRRGGHLVLGVPVAAAARPVVLEHPQPGAALGDHRAVAAAAISNCSPDGATMRETSQVASRQHELSDRAGVPGDLPAHAVGLGEVAGVAAPLALLGAGHRGTERPRASASTASTSSRAATLWARRQGGSRRHRGRYGSDLGLEAAPPPTATARAARRRVIITTSPGSSSSGVHPARRRRTRGSRPGRGRPGSRTRCVGSIAPRVHTPADSQPTEGADPAVEDHVGALAGALAGEELLLVGGPLLPVLGHADRRRARGRGPSAGS